MSNIQPHETSNTVETTDEGLDLLLKQAKAMDAAHQLATALCNTSMVPATFRGKPDDGAAAILYGAELGLKPQQALQQVFVVHGQPAIYARTMGGLLKAKGYRFETLEDTPESVTVRGTSPRGETETSTWTINRAKSAGYTSNKKYQTDPQAMLYAKALSEVCRKLAPDVLLGIRYTAEDLELEPLQMTATRSDQADNRGMDKVRAALEQKQAEPEQPQVDPLTPFLERITTADSMDTLGLVMQDVAETFENGNHPDQGKGGHEYEQARSAANRRAEEINA